MSYQNIKVGDTAYWKPWGSRALRDNVIMSGEVVEYRPGGVFEYQPGSAVGCVSIACVTVKTTEGESHIMCDHLISKEESMAMKLSGA